MTGTTTTVASQETLALLQDLADTGVRLRSAGDGGLSVIAPPGRLTPDLRTRIAGHKEELLRWLGRTGGEAARDLPAVRADLARLHDPFPPSDLQMSFLVGGREELEFHVRPHQYMEFDVAALDPARFTVALNAALERQHANIVVVDDDLHLRTVRDPAPLQVPVTDVRDRDEAVQQAHLDAVRADMIRAELPLERWPWMQVRITRYGPDRARIHWNNNNFFSDGPGSGQFLNSVWRLYERPGEHLPPLRISYRDCILALEELAASAPGRRSGKYWADRLPGLPPAPELPLAPGAETRSRSRLSRRETVLDRPGWERLKAGAAARGLTATNVLHAVYAEILGRFGGTRHFLLNNMVTHRLPMHPQIGEVIGNFAALYPLEVDLRHDESFAARARRLQERVMADLEHTYVSGVQVLQQLNQVRGTPGRAVCPYVVGSGLFMGELQRPVFSHLETPQVLLDCQFWEQPDGSLWVVWDLIEAMFPDGLIDAMQDRYRALLRLLADDPRTWDLHELPLMPPEQQAYRARLNRPSTLPAGLLGDALATVAAERPGAVAVADGSRRLSYGDLAARAGAVAGRLAQAGVGAGDLAAVLLSKGADQLVAVHGILRAGGAYVPIDPSWPDERVGVLLDATGATAVLTDPAGRDRLARMPGRSVAVVEVTEQVPAEPPPAPPREPGDLAYVIFTSGSTGRPKGAALDHRGPLNTVLDVNRRFGITAADVVFGVSSLCFDLSVYDIFGTAACGATLVLPPAGRTDPAGWLDTVRRERVTVWNSVPALMELFTEAAEAAGATFPDLRVVLLSGDWIPVGLPQRIRGVAPGARVISLGGATEASIWSIFHPAGPPQPGWVSVPYGRPLANQTWHVLDEALRDAPDWVPGELYIGGAGVARGYLGDAERTAASFVSHPRTGERLYRTGDQGRFRPGGDIEFLGRVDFQVKIQGFRVEPGEVEHVLLGHPAVQQAGVVARGSAAGRQLAAFVVPAPGAAPEPEDLTAFLRSRLPAYLVPAHLAVLDRLPLTGNGKVDRRALETLAPARADVRRTFVAPRTPDERALCEIWESLLQVSPVGVTDDFFDIGGQSFAALRMLVRIRRRFGRNLSLGRLLQSRTVEALAAELAGADDIWSPLVPLRSTGDPEPPWFVVHPAGGNVLAYRALAERLTGDAYGLQAPHPGGGRSPLAAVGDFAGLYEDAVRSVRPSGPYRLAGWSSGAVIVHELAHRLEAAGEVVERLVLIDCPAPVPVPQPGDADLVTWFAEDLALGFTAADLAADHRELVRRADPDRRLGVLLDLPAAAGIRAAGLDEGHLRPALEVFTGVIEACNRHRPGVVDAGIDLIRAADGRVGEFAGHPHTDDPDWGWASLTRGRVRTTTVPGTHHSILTGGREAAVATVLNGAG